MSKYCIPPAAAALCRALPLAFMLAACSTSGTQWVKPGVSEAQRAQDLDDCQLRGQAVAMSEAAREQQLQTTTPIAGGVTSIQAPGTQSLSFLRQAEVFEECMRGRGYAKQ